MLPLLLKAPQGKPARIVGLGNDVLRTVRNLSASGWPVVLHDAAGGGTLAGLPGIRIALDAPATEGIRQSSLVIIGKEAPDVWRDGARQSLEGSGVPFMDERDPAGSTLAFPRWFPGDRLHLAAWGSRPEDGMADAFLQETEALFLSFSRLASELKALVFESMEDEEFRRHVTPQLCSPEILGLLLKGEYDQAQTTALKVVGTSTRRLD